jgi:hypothetical protein
MSDHWRSEALCRHFSAMPWLEDPEDRSWSVEAAMEAVCRACPVRPDCETYVTRYGIVSGFWAGRDRTPDAEATSHGGAA